jgi:hypothetical protein
LCLFGLVFYAIDSTNTWHAQFGVCRIPWVPDGTVCAIFFAAAVFIVVIFCFKLHKVDDGFSISRELRFSITLILGGWTLFFSSLYIGGPFTTPGGQVSPYWFVIIAQIGSSTAAVYLPLYSSYTKKWLDVAPSPTELQPVSVIELREMNYFLTAPSALQPFLRFLHSEFSAELLFLWCDIQEFANEQDAVERKAIARTILKDYLDPEGTKFMPDSESFRENIQLHIEDAETPTAMFQQLKVEVEKRMSAIFNRFIISSGYKQYVSSMAIKGSLAEVGMA